jgi:diguanylate cyclase
MIDLDRFRAVNDTLGHHVGDRLLTLVGQRFPGRVRAADVVARLGGDEVAVLLHGADLQAARRAAVAHYDQLDEPFSIESSMLQVGGSIGVAPSRTGPRSSGRRISSARASSTSTASSTTGSPRS